MEDLRNGLLPGRKMGEEMELFADEPETTPSVEPASEFEPEFKPEFEPESEDVFDDEFEDAFEDDDTDEIEEPEIEPEQAQEPEQTEEEEAPPCNIDSEITNPPPASRKMAYRISDDAPLGQTLSELRAHNNFTVQEVAEETKIRSLYLEALEEEDYQNLPQLVYVLGYVRKLCTLYGVPDEDADALTAGLRERLQYELPDDLNKHTSDRERSEVDERRQRQLVMMITGAIALVVIALIAGTILIVLAIRSSGSSAAAGDPFNEALLVEIQPKPELRIQELK